MLLAEKVGEQGVATVEEVVVELDHLAHAATVHR